MSLMLSPREKRQCTYFFAQPSHAFMQQPLNKSCVLPIERHISHQILLKLVLSALKNPTSNDYYESCSNCQQLNNSITIPILCYFHEISRLCSYLCPSEFTCINISFSTRTTFECPMLLLYVPFSTKKEGLSASQVLYNDMKTNYY